MRLVSQLLRTVQREETDEDGRTVFRLYYTLWRDVVPSGDAFFYIKCVLERRCGLSLTGTDLEIADGLGRDPELAAAVFNRLVQASSPPFPVHLKDVVRDLVTELGARAEEYAASYPA